MKTFDNPNTIANVVFKTTSAHHLVESSQG